jgi:hypothetical protein
MKIQKDNLTSEQKKSAYLKILLLIIIICAFFIYKKYDSETRENLLSENIEFTFCEIVGINTHHGVTNYLEYSVNGKKYETRPSGRKSIKIGEFYEIKYSKSNPEISKVDYTKPVIHNKNNYTIENGIVTEIFENQNWKILSFVYNYENEKYERKVILEKIGELKKGENIEILVNLKNPDISYLIEQFKTE